MRTLKPAFTLIELLVVLVIIGVVYTLAGTLMKAPAKPGESPQWSIERLDESLRNAHAGYAKLRCEGDRCERCALFDATGAVLREPIALFSQIPAVYRFDRTGYLDTVRFPPGVCFEMERFENGAVSDLLLEYDKRFFRYYPLLRPVEVSTDFEQMRKSLDAAAWMPTDQSRYFHERD
ncbi:MAG: prepilin-type N-terminal cleavage/methylation domain-containing protein [Campylobacterales bacterium]